MKLKQLIADSGRSLRALAIDAGLGETAVKDILNGKSVDPKFSTIAALARQLKTSMESLLDLNDDGAAAYASAHNVEKELKEPALPIRGAIQAGAWLMVAAVDQREPKTHPARPDPRYPTDAQWLSRVKADDSMNALTKDAASASIVEGDLALVVDAKRIGYLPHDGDLVEVERLRFGGKERELTLRQVEIKDGRVLLCPRSHNKFWRDAVECIPAGEPQGGVTAKIRGKVLQVLRQY